MNIWNWNAKLNNITNHPIVLVVIQNTKPLFSESWHKKQAWDDKKLFDVPFFIKD